MIEATRKLPMFAHDSGDNHVAEAVDEIQGQNPGIFGPNGGYSRAISITSMSWTLGMFLGPILAGYGTEQIGYYAMNCILGTFVPCRDHSGLALTRLAGMCAICAFIAVGSLKTSVPQQPSQACGEE